MGFFDAIDISGSGLSAERLRMDVLAENLARSLAIWSWRPCSATW